MAVGSAARWAAGAFSSPTSAASFSPLAGRSALSGVGRSVGNYQPEAAPILGTYDARQYGGDPERLAASLYATVTVLDAAAIAARRRLWRWPEPDKSVKGCVHVGERRILIRRGQTLHEHQLTLAHECGHLLYPRADEAWVIAWTYAFEIEARRLGAWWVG